MACFDVVKDFVALWPRNIATRRAYRFCFISNGSVLIHTRHCERLTLYHKVASCDWAVRAARQTLTLPQQEEHDKAVSVRSSDGTYAIAAETHQESLVLLEWPALCRQVAAFANTSTAAQRIVESGLTMGRSKAESEELLQQTEEAGLASLKFDHINNLYPVIAAAKDGFLLRVRQLHAVAGTLEAALSLKLQLSRDDTGNGTGFESLKAIMQPVFRGMPEVLQEIQFCVGEGGSFILDRADEKLATARAKKRDTYQLLSKQSEEIARNLFASKASDTPQVNQKRGRLCVSVKSGRQGELPKGSVKLGASRTGATVYMEPRNLLELNNAVLRLQNLVEEAENAVLMKLTESVARQADHLEQIMDALVQMDIISCRAKHGQWLAGVRPVFHERQEDRGSISISGARHPLLLARSLPPLPKLIEQDDSEFESDFMGKVVPFSQTKLASIADSSGEDSNTEDQHVTQSLPQPIQLLVPPGKASVVLTGPNTGGKTASLKTLGLLATMPKAGLFIPADPARPPELEWFSEVLADVGDSQDLAQNLSTFSGHLQRLKRITAAVSPSSLVLLDELGSGTDPVEGGCLAAVMLEWLLPRARLTFCTSHHADLKELSAKDVRFVNANVEFNVKTLMPTYRLQWGAAGESQALAVAEGLGFDPDIVEAAHKIANQATFMSKPDTHAGELKDSLADEVEGARKDVGAVAQQRDQAAKKLSSLEKELERLTALKTQMQEKKADNEAASAKLRRTVQTLLETFQAGRIPLEKATQELEQMKASAKSQREATRTKFGVTDSGIASEYEPQIGDSVRLLSMGGAQAKVASVSEGGRKIVVMMGNLPAVVRKSDLVPWSGASPAVQNQRKRKNSSRKALQEMKSEASEAAKKGELPGQRHVARIQVAENTADLRGMYVLEALEKLEDAIATCPPDSVLFVIHGLGTGKIRAAVQERLQAHSLVKSFEYERDSQRGCTVVEFHN